MAVPRAMTLLATLALATAAGCGDGADRDAAGDDGRLSVVTTVAPITSIAANVIGDLADIEGLVPEGTNSHTFEPRPSAAETLAGADVVFLNGLVLEEPTRELAEEVMGDDATLVALGEQAIEPDDYRYDVSFPEAAGRPNPHLWTDPPLALRYAEIIADTMAELDPANADAYARNYEAFAGAVDELDAAMRASFATIPVEHRKLLTYHDAFAYFGDDYDWTVIGAIQVADFDEPSPREVADLIDQVEAEGVRAIFGSEVFPSPVLEQIGTEAGVRYVDVLRDDDLPGGPGDAQHSWLGLMRFDYATIVDALGGDSSALAALDVGDAAPDQAAYPQ